MDDLRTLCLAGMLLLSLVLPLQANAAESTAQKNSPLKQNLVWRGQICGAFCGLLLITSSVHPIFILTIATLTTCFYAQRLQGADVSLR